MSWPAIKWARKQNAGSTTAKAVLICLAHHADQFGYCWPSQETIASEIESSVDSVQRALKKHLVPRLVRRIKRKSSDGRRISDAYQLNLGGGTDTANPNPRGPAPCGPADGRCQTANAAFAEPQRDDSADRTVRPKSLKENIQESSGRLLRCTPGGRRLEKRLGKAVFDSWFVKVFFVEERDRVLLLHTDNRFVASRVEQQFDQNILDCFRPEYETAVRVKALVWKDAMQAASDKSAVPSVELAPAGNSDRGGSAVSSDFESLKSTKDQA